MLVLLTSFVAQARFRLPPWEAPVMLDEQRELFFFFSFSEHKPKMDCELGVDSRDLHMGG